MKLRALACLLLALAVCGLVVAQSSNDIRWHRTVHANDPNLAIQPLTEYLVTNPPWSAACDGASDDRPEIQAAIDYLATRSPVGGKAKIPCNRTCRIAAPLVLKDRVVLEMCGVITSAIEPTDSFTFNGTTDALVQIGAVGETGNIFGARIENGTLNCRQRPNCIGVYSDSANEGSGWNHLHVRQAMKKGVYLTGTANRNMFAEHLQAAINDPNGVGLHLDGVSEQNTFSDVSIAYDTLAGTPDANNSRGILLTNSKQVVLAGVHTEQFSVGVDMDANSYGTIHGITGTGNNAAMMRFRGKRQGAFNIMPTGSAPIIQDQSGCSGNSSDILSFDGSYYFIGALHSATCTVSTDFIGTVAGIPSTRAEQLEINEMTRHNFVGGATYTRKLLAGTATVDGTLYANAASYWQFQDANTITSITTDADDQGRLLIIGGVTGTTLTDGAGTLRLNGNWVAASGEDRIALMSDGTSYNEVARAFPAGGGGGNSFSTIGTATADSSTDTLSINDSLGIDFATANDPESLTGNFLYTHTLAGNPALNADECVFTTDGTGGGILCEGAANTVEQILVMNPSGSDKTITIPNVSGTLVTVEELVGGTIVPEQSLFATELAADPTDCGANTWATGIATTGNLTCTALTGVLPLAGGTMTGSITGLTGDTTTGDVLIIPPSSDDSAAQSGSIRFNTKGHAGTIAPWIISGNNSDSGAENGQADHVLRFGYNMKPLDDHGSARYITTDHVVSFQIESRFTNGDPDTSRGSVEINLDIDPNIGTSLVQVVRPFGLHYDMDARKTVLGIGVDTDANSAFFQLNDSINFWAHTSAVRFGDRSIAGSNASSETTQGRILLAPGGQCSDVDKAPCIKNSSGHLQIESGLKTDDSPGRLFLNYKQLDRSGSPAISPVWVGEGDFDTGQFGIKGKFDTYQLHVVALASQGAAIFRISKSDDTPLVTVHNDGLETIFGGTEYLDDDVDTTCGAGNYNISADASETQLKVCNNGVKSNLASPLTTNGDLHYHNGTVDSRLARGSDGQCLTSNASSIVWGSCAGAGGGDNLRAEDGDNTGAFTAMVDADFDDSGDINFARAAGPPDVITGTVRADSVALTTDTTGNYLSEVAAGTGIAVSGAAGEGFTKTVSLDYTDAGTDPGFAAGECRFSNEGGSAAGWVCEGETADALETRFRVTDPTSADRIVTIPNADSTTVQSASCSGGDRVSAISSAGVVTCTATPSLARIAGASGAAGADLTWQNLTSDSADCTTTALCSAAMTTTGVGAGTWAFTYTLLYQTAVNTTGIAFGINHTGTATLPGAMWVHTTTGTTTANATGDSAATTAAGQLSEGRSGLTLNAVIGAAGAGVDTANTNILAVLSGILVVTGSGSLELKLGSEVGSSAVRIMADSVLELRKIE